MAVSFFYIALYFIKVALLESCRIIDKNTMHKFIIMSFQIGQHNDSIQLNTQLRIMANKLKIYLNGFYDRSIQPGMYDSRLLCKYISRTCSLIFQSKCDFKNPKLTRKIRNHVSNKKLLLLDFHICKLIDFLICSEGILKGRC